MDFRQLQYVLTVAEEKNFSKAANKLFISQPSLSQYIQKIELELGTQLFDRSSSPLKLTFAGELYIETAKNILDLKDQLYQQINDIANRKKGRVIIGLSPVRSTYIMPKILPIFHDKFPDIEVVLIEDISSTLETLAVKGSTDIDLITTPMQNDMLDFETIFSEEILVVIPPNHPIQSKIKYKTSTKSTHPTIELKELKNEPFILLKRDQKLHKMATSLCEQAGFSPRIILESESIEAAHALAKAGMGITFVPDTLISSHQTEPYPLYCSIDKLKPTRDVIVAYKKGRYLSVAAREFISILKTVFPKNQKDI
ncbi:LysR family transcriptional regulator [Clostridium sp. JS66]|uniref:LysR family transcriptional regulator n=1 Tax=Clostridium sp. JS66 TaxID=3064705 RepID=UPI00298DA372|nr:LysR family transcriptional regulator [Clostridium sp. JS66]WPC41242.1 LysR family transcriptional regulator [Clostridium sp. JS66]